MAIPDDGAGGDTPLRLSPHVAEQVRSAFSRASQQLIGHSTGMPTVAGLVTDGAGELSGDLSADTAVHQASKYYQKAYADAKGDDGSPPKCAVLDDLETSRGDATSGAAAARDKAQRHLTADFTTNLPLAVAPVCGPTGLPPVDLALGGVAGAMTGAELLYDHVPAVKHVVDDTVDGVKDAVDGTVHAVSSVGHALGGLFH